MTTFPDVVALLIGYLDGLVTPVPVSSGVPNPRPATFVQVRRVGGPFEWPVRDRARVDIITWAPDEGTAHDLCQTMRSAAHDLRGTATLGAVCYEVEEFLGPRQDDDELTGTPRYWMTLAFTLRAQ